MDAADTETKSHVRTALGTFVRHRYGVQLGDGDDLFLHASLTERARLAKDVCEFIRDTFGVPMRERDLLTSRRASIASISVLAERRMAAAQGA